MLRFTLHVCAIMFVLIAIQIVAVPYFASSAGAAPLPIPAAYLKAAHQPSPPPAGTYAKIAWVICRTFTFRCHDALEVAWCESSFRPWATDYATGTHWGLFQEGPSERKTYGYGKGAWAQARSGLLLWKARGTQPWSSSKHCHGH